ncbi:MAG: Dam family site-specific DNA-(adenine-N6)-methyltransferase [Gammaproteobacteria bacterium]|nr:Dam family site-specific DNA-(adenine-N6)-methyltransferase [Gammaproteobacteria bacterium]
MKPFLKWAGNKYRQAEQIKCRFPQARRLIEPFVGSGALFLNTNYEHYLLNDRNTDLINLYHALKTEGRPFIDYCKCFFTPENNKKDAFYLFRELFNTTQDTRLKSALFVYLNRHCFNGLCRYNSKNKFNTPFGKYQQPYFPEQEMLFFHQQAQKALFKMAHFVEIMETAQLGDVVYCDPPYVPLSKTAHFTCYSQEGFSQDQHITLASLAQQLANKGIPVIISNHQTDFTLSIYKEASIETFEIQRNISCHGEKRGKTTELLAVFS